MLSSRAAWGGRRGLESAGNWIGEWTHHVFVEDALLLEGVAEVAAEFFVVGEAAGGGVGYRDCCCGFAS
jgi:hypothetical protein